jgi:hypothetical protein
MSVPALVNRKVVDRVLSIGSPFRVWGSPGILGVPRSKCDPNRAGSRSPWVRVDIEFENTCVQPLLPSLSTIELARSGTI